MNGTGEANMAVAQDQFEDLMAKLRQEFLDTAEDHLSEIDAMLRGLRGGRGGDETASEIRRRVHSLKGMGGTFGYPLITVISHRMEDYLAELDALAGPNLEDAQVFVDRMRDVVDGVFQPDDPNTADIVRTLPDKTHFDVAEVTKTDVEVMLVSPKDTASHFVERELRACGYRVVNEPSSFGVFEHVVRTRPDMIIATAVMEGLSGIDLACALAAMPATRTIPFALLTSFEDSDTALRELSPTIPVIHKGASFSDDLAEALDRCGIT
jgi:HPt (histidine-containing phosphotransfer) domain-containing protein/CheY-like chemotaxis protein